jgi:hypothetical protein
MGMSTGVEGFAPPDETWRKMKSIWNSCNAANVPIPAEVQKFFNYDRPDESGVRIKLLHPQHESVSKYDDSKGCASGFEIDLSKLPKQIKTLRFYNSW